MSSSFVTPEGIMFEASDPEDDAPETGEDAVEGLRRLRTPNISANVSMQQQIARMKESIPSDDEGEFSPIGSPMGGGPNFGGREKFLELQRKLQEDELNRPKAVSSSTSDFENPDEDFQWEGVIDVEALLQSLQNEQGGSEQSYASTALNECTKFREMHDQIKERDIKLLDLESKLHELDRQVLDLQDTISQRDKVISSKNEAVTVIQEKFRREALEKEEELKKTQKTLFEMEKILSSAQVQWKSEKEQLNSELQQHIKKIETLQDTNRELEAKNCDITQFESEKETLQHAVQDKDQELGLKTCQIDELTAELESSKAQISKLKTQYQNKLKALKAKQKETSEKDSLKFVEKENRISELEEEKGNLLLQLMDFDEQQATFSGLKNKVEELEAKVNSEEAIVLSLTEKVSQLQEENSNLSSSLERSQEEVERLNSTLTEIEKSSQESRVTLEMRVVELEEERDDIIHKSSYFTEPIQATSENLTKGEEELQLTDRRLTSSVTVCTDTSDLVSTSEQTTGTTESDQNTIGVKRARASSGNIIPEEKEEEVFTGKASSLFSSPATQVTGFEQQGWGGWGEPEIEPSSTAFQYINLDDESPENLASPPPENVPPYVESNQGHVYPNQVYDANQWGFDDTADTFVQVKSPFTQESAPNLVGHTYEFENLQTQLGILTSTCDNFKSDLVAKTHECENLEQEIRVLRIDYEQLSSGTQDDNNVKKELLERKAELNEVQIELEKTREVLITKERDLESTSAYVAEMRSELEDKLNQITTSSQIIDSIKSSLNEKDAIITRLASDINNFDLVMEEKSSTVTDLLEKVEEKSKVIGGLRNDLKNSQAEYEKLLGNLDERESNVSTIGVLKSQITELRGELCQRDEEFEELRKKLTDSENLLDLNESELMDLRSRENDMIGGYQKISAEFDALQIAYEQVKSELEESKSQENVAPSSSFFGQAEETTAPLKALIAEKDEALKNLSEKSTKVEEKLKKALVMLKQKNRELSELRTKATSVSNLSFGEEQTGSGPQSLSPIPVVDNQKDVEKWQNECMEKETKLGLIQTKLQNLQSEVDDLTMSRKQALDLVKNKENEINELNNSLKWYETEMTNLTDNIAALQLKAVEGHALKIQMEQLRENLNATEQEMEKIQSELTLKSNELESMDNKRDVEKWQNECSAKDTKLGLMQTSLENMQSQVDDLIMSKVQALELVKTKEDEINHLNSSLKWYKSEMTNLTDNTATLQLKALEADAQKVQMEQLLGTLNETEAELHKIQSELTSKSSELESMVNPDRLNEVILQRDELKESLKQKDEHIGHLESRVEETLALLANNQDQIQLLEKEILQTRNFKEEEFYELNNSLRTTEAEKTNLMDTIATLQLKVSEGDALQAKVEHLLVSLNETETEMQKIQNELTSKSDELETMVNPNMLNEVVLQRDELQDSLKLKEEHIAQLESRIEETLALNHNQIQFLENELLQTGKTKADEINELNNSLKWYEAEMTNLTDNIAALQLKASEGDALKAQVEQLCAKLNETETEMQKIQSELTLKSMELESMLNHQSNEVILYELKESLKLKDERIAHLESKIEETLVQTQNQIQFLEREIWDKNNIIAQFNSNSNVSTKAAAVDSFMKWDDIAFGDEPQQSQKQGGDDWWLGTGGSAEAVEEPVVKTKSFVTNVQSDNTEETLRAELQSKDSRIYELEVQLTELEINLQDATSQVNNLSSELETSSYDHTRVKQENIALVQEVESLKRARSELAAELESRTLAAVPSLVEEEVTPETSEIQTSSTGGEDEKKKLTAELRELKVRNGKMLQRLKQLNDKHNALTKEHEGLKKKNEYSLEGAYQEEVAKEMKQKDEIIAENSKLIGEFKLEKDRLVEKVDILERANERIIEMNENQNAYCQQLVNQKKQLEQEISGLKWRLEEVENISNSQPDAPSGDYYVHPQPQEDPQVQIQRDAMMSAAAQEIEYLRQENFRLNSFIQVQGQTQVQTQELNTVPTAAAPPAPAELLISPTVTAGLAEGNLSESDIENLQKSLENERNEKVILERKIELLQGKILEIEQSEIKCFEEALMLKSWTRQLEMDNLKYQKEMEQIYNSVSDGDMNNLKVKTLQNEVVRLVETLHERDKRCEELTIEITRMLEERDGLQLKLSNVLQHNVSLHEEANKGKESPTGDIPSFDKEVLKMKLAELEGVNFAIKLDLRREREARRLVQEQLLFSQSSRVYRDLTSRNKISFSSPAPSPRIKSASPPQSPSLPPDSPVPVPVSQGSQPSTPQQI